MLHVIKSIHIDTELNSSCLRRCFRIYTFMQKLWPKPLTCLLIFHSMHSERHIKATGNKKQEMTW